MPSEARDRGYLFGCCAACRAPFVPKDARLFGYKETQTVYYLVSRFKAISELEGSRSDFSDSRVKGHVFSVAHVAPAHAFVRSLGPAAAALDEAVEGWAPVLGDRSFRGNCFRMQTGTSRRMRGVDNQDLVDFGPDALSAVRSARDRVAADPSLDPTEADLEILKIVANSSSTVYQAVWDSPQLGVRHADLARWVRAKDIRQYAIDLSRTLPICDLCNHIWDTFARLSRTLRSDSVIPQLSVTVRNGRANMQLPRPAARDSDYQRRLGCLAAYYLHGSLKNVKANLGRRVVRVEGDRRQTVAALCWLALHAHCMYQEMLGRATGGDSVKGMHNYLGCLDLIISYYLFVCATVDPDRPFSGAVPFERFHVFYVKELAECPPPVWDPAHRRLHEFVFDAGYTGLTTEGGRIDRVSSRLLELYTGVVAPLLGVMLGSPAATVADLAAERFFLTSAEADELVDGFLAQGADNIDTVRLQLDRVGGSALLWQLQRGLRDENEKFQKELGLWMKKRMQGEWKNISANRNPNLSLREAQMIYLLMHTRDPSPTLPAIGGPAEAVLALAGDSTEDPESALEAMRSAGRCSMWKAALRLRAWRFTQEIPDVIETLADEDSNSSGDEGASNWRWTTPRPKSRRGRRITGGMAAAAAAADDLAASMASLKISSLLANHTV